MTDRTGPSFSGDRQQCPAFMTAAKLQQLIAARLQLPPRSAALAIFCQQQRVPDDMDIGTARLCLWARAGNMELTYAQLVDDDEEDEVDEEEEL
jgi:hypothetical protein